jgi:glutaredoxin 3
MSGKIKKVTVYTTDYCPYCRNAIKLLNSKNVKYEVIDVTNSPETRERLVAMSGGRTTVPQIFVDNKSIGGYQDLLELYNSGQGI